MKLLTLKLTNFKGQRDLLLEPKGEDFQIYADNGLGKTTIADAFFWLFFDKDSLNRKDFEVKTIDPETNKAFRGLDHEVYAEVEIGGTVTTFQKSYKEKWVKERGGATKEFSGHTTDYKVNGVPVQKKEFDAHVAEICEEKRFRLLSDPSYFNTVKTWQERRQILLEICGDFTDEEIIVQNPKLAELTEILGKHSIDNYRKILTARRKEANAEIASIPIRIDELTRSTPPQGELIPLEPIEAIRQELAEQRARLVAGGEAAEKTKLLREKEAELQDLETILRSRTNAGANAAQDELNKLQLSLSVLRNNAVQDGQEVESMTANLARINAQLDGLRSLYRERNATEFTWNGTDTCAACDQSLPAFKVQEARSNAEEEFNAAKSRFLEANKEEGQALKNRQAELEEALTRTKASLAETQAKIETKTAEVEAAQSKVVPIIALDYSQTPRHAELMKAIAEIKAEADELRLGNSNAIEALDQKQREANANLQEAQAAKAKADQHEQNLVRIDELKAQERTLAQEIERIDRENFLTEEFIRTKVKSLTEKINSKFTIARFKLFDEQINGAIAETCETTVEGVPYSSLNTGMRLNVGLDIINLLATHYDFAPLVIIDGAESVTRILPTQGQQLKLIVSEPDKALRVVIELTKENKKIA